MTFPPKFLDSFKIKVLNPLKTGQQSQNAFWLFVKESFSLFPTTRPAFQRLHLVTLKLLASPEGKAFRGTVKKASLAGRLVALQAQTQKENIRIAALHVAKLILRL